MADEAPADEAPAAEAPAAEAPGGPVAAEEAPGGPVGDEPVVLDKAPGGEPVVLDEGAIDSDVGEAEEYEEDVSESIPPEALILFRDVQVGLGKMQKPRVKIYLLLEAATLYITLREANKKSSGSTTMDDLIKSFLMPPNEIKVITARIKENPEVLRYKLRKCNKSNNILQQYNYMVNHWDDFVRANAALKLDNLKNKNFLAYKTFNGHVQKLKKICTHFHLFVWQKQEKYDPENPTTPSLSIICTFFNSCKKIVDIERRMQEATGHDDFTVAGLDFRNPNKPQKERKGPAIIRPPIGRLDNAHAELDEIKRILAMDDGDRTQSEIEFLAAKNKTTTKSSNDEIRDEVDRIMAIPVAERTGAESHFLATNKPYSLEEMTTEYVHIAAKLERDRNQQENKFFRSFVKVMDKITAKAALDRTATEQKSLDTYIELVAVRLREQQEKKKQLEAEEEKKKQLKAEEEKKNLEACKQRELDAEAERAKTRLTSPPAKGLAAKAKVTPNPPDKEKKRPAQAKNSGSSKRHKAILDRVKERRAEATIDWIYRNQQPSIADVIDLTSDSEDESSSLERISKPVQKPAKWVQKQRGIIKMLNLLQVRLDYSEDSDLHPTPCQWIEWFKAMEEDEGLEDSKVVADRRCWRAVMALILSKGTTSVAQLENLVADLQTAGLFTAEAVEEMTESVLAKILEEHEGTESSALAEQMKTATHTILHSDASNSSIYEEQALIYRKNECDIHAVQIALALNWSELPKKQAAQPVDFKMCQKHVQEQLLDWLGEREVDALSRLLPRIGRFFDAEDDRLDTLKAFIDKELVPGVEKKATLEVIAQIEQYYNKNSEEA